MDDQHLWQIFSGVDSDRNQHITAEELQLALKNTDYSNFNAETCRLLVNMFDTDKSGTITFEEFRALWRYILDWQKCFQGFDRDRSGTIDANELRQALYTFGFNISPRLINILILKFDLKGKTSIIMEGNGSVQFSDFIQICVQVKNLTDSFRRFDSDNDGWINIDYETFLELVMGNK
eukprot:NODE_132_length_16614_cov_0.935392.p12 type:complete len:178 gc:universal NODE_132_length_16614_cov_0.935392:10395-10928(+)